MADVTVSQFAEVLKVPVEKLLVQLDQAGIKVQGPDDRISDEAKLELLSHLRRSHGQGSEEVNQTAAPRKITLQRKQQSEIKLAGAAGRARTVNVEVRVKRTYIKRDVLEEQARAAAPEDDLKAREAEEAAQAERERHEHERRESERLEAENRRRIEEESAARKAAEEARRQAEQRDREQTDADRSGRARGRTEAPAAPERAAVEAKPVKTAAEADRDRRTKYGRAELHIGGDASRRKKKQRVRERKAPMGMEQRHGFELPTAKVVREVGVGETITPQELAQKMAVKATEVIKVMMNLGLMATINQPIDQDTAVLVVEEMGHTAKLLRDDEV